MWSRCALVAFSASLLLTLSTGAQTPRQRKLAAARAAWFAHTRVTLDHRSPAAHRLIALRQKAQLSVITPHLEWERWQGRQRHAYNALATSGGSWTELGPAPQHDPFYQNVSGRVTSLADDISDDPTGNILYVGTANGGVWKSTNALSSAPTFTPISDQTQSLAVGALALDASTSPATLYVGSGEANSSSLSYYGVGIFRSTDGGLTWTLSSSADSGTHPFFGMSFARILPVPSAPGTVLACGASPGVADAQSLGYTRGVYRSTDSGNTWSLVPSTDFSSPTAPGGFSCTDLLYEPQTQTIYAALRGNGVYKSVDQGATFTPVSLPFASATTTATLNNFYRASFATQNGTVYVAVVNSSGSLSTSSACTTTTQQNCDTGMAQTSDGGKTWTPIAPPGFPGQTDEIFGPNAQGTYDLYLQAIPGGGLLLGGIDTFSSTNISGLTTAWSNNTRSYTDGVVHPDEHAVVALDASHWFVGNDGGVWSTADGGGTWNDLNTNIGTIQFLGVTADPFSPGTYLGGSQDNGTAKTVQGLNWQTVYGGDGGFTAIDPTTAGKYFGEDEYVYPDTQNQWALVRSDTAGSVSAQNSSFQTVFDGATLNQQAAFYIPYQLVPTDSSKVVLGASQVWRGPASPSAPNSGWQAISPVLTSTSYDYIQSVSVAPTDSNVIYAATIGGALAETSNANSSSPQWSDITPGPVVGAPLSAIAVCPINAGTAFLGIGAFSSGSALGHVYRIDNFGGSWTDITGNFPDVPVNSIAVDPQNANNIYVGTDIGVFVATDGGQANENWQVLGTGLPDTPAMQVSVTNGANPAVVVATHGRGAWTIPALPPPNGQDFSITAAQNALTIAAGKSATVGLTLAPVNGLGGNANLSCLSSVANVTCSLSSSNVALNGSATLTITATTAAVGAAGRPNSGASFLRLFPVILAALLALLLWLSSLRFLPSIPKRWMTAAVLPAVLLGGTLLFSACGGGGAPAPVSNNPSGGTTTATGSTAQITVDAQDGPLNHTSTILVTVQ